MKSKICGNILAAEWCRRGARAPATAALILELLCFADTLHAAAPILGAPARNGGQFQFTLTGKSNEIYVIEASTNLHSWTPVSTNASPMAIRLIELPAPERYSFYRAFRLRMPLFRIALAARDSVDLNGNNLSSDSFDSSDPNYSTMGFYDPAKRKDNGGLAAYASLTNSLSVGNVKIAGRVFTSPTGTVNIGPNGSIGSLAWIAVSYGIKPGWLVWETPVDVLDVPTPSTAGSFTINGTAQTINGTNYDYVLSGGVSGASYVAEELLLNNKAMLIQGNVRLYAQSNLVVAGTGSIQIAAGASLKLYVAAPTASIGGNGIINNTTNALNFQYYGLPGNTAVILNANGSFMGVIYAPSADLSLSVSGNQTLDFVGASVTRSLRLSGHSRFHYDESLARLGPSL